MTTRPSETDSKSVLVRVGRQSAAYALASLVGPGTGLLLLPVYTKYLSLADYGLIAVLEVVALILTSVFSLGMPALVQFVYVDRTDVERRKIAMGTLFVSVTAVNVVLAAVAMWATKPILGMLLPSLPFWPYVPLVILTTFIEPYWTMAGAALQIQERAGRFAAWSLGRVAVSITSRIVLVVVLLEGAAGFVTANLVTAAVFAVAAIVVLRAEIALRFSFDVVREALRVGGPTVPNNLLNYGFRLLDRIVMERFVGLEQVGLYYIALRLADILRLASDVLVNSWRPVFFKEAEDDRFKNEDVPRIIRLATVALVGLFVCLSVFAREIVAIFAAPPYRSASMFVPLLTAAMVLKGFQAFPYLAIWLRRKTNWVPILSALTLVASVGFNVMFARQWGAMGVAGALVASYLFLTIAMVAVAHRLYRIEYPWRALATTVALGIGVVAVSAALPDGAVSILVRLSLVVGFGLAIVITGTVRASELRDLWPARVVALEPDKATAL